MSLVINVSSALSKPQMSSWQLMVKQIYKSCSLSSWKTHEENALYIMKKKNIIFHLCVMKTRLCLKRRELQKAKTHSLIMMCVNYNSKLLINKSKLKKHFCEKKKIWKESMYIYDILLKLAHVINHSFYNVICMKTFCEKPNRLFWAK